MDLSGRIAVVTGANGSIGRAISMELARQGASVALDCRSRSDAAEAAVEEIRAFGGKAMVVLADVTRPDQVRAMVERVVSAWGGVDIVVNVAGIMDPAPLGEMSDEQWRRVIDINLNGVFNVSSAAIEYLKKSSCGRIINIASQAAFRGSVNNCNYCAAKAGMIGMTYALARELGKYGVTVNAVSPGRIMTELLGDYQGKADRKVEKWMEETPLGRFGTSEEIAEMVAFLASDKGSYITGANMNINGGMLVG